MKIKPDQDVQYGPIFGGGDIQIHLKSSLLVPKKIKVQFWF